MRRLRSVVPSQGIARWQGSLNSWPTLALGAGYSGATPGLRETQCRLSLPPLPDSESFPSAPSLAGPPPAPPAELLVVGRVVAAQGLGGEVRVLPLSDFPERFTTAGWRWLRPRGGGAPTPGTPARPAPAGQGSLCAAAPGGRGGSGGGRGAGEPGSAGRLVRTSAAGAR
jgi:hypothetical protein